MILEVDTTSAVPAYEQLRSQLAEMILSGALPKGHRLPAIRQLANDLGLAPGTVARVYRELELNGMVVSRVRHGTIVAALRRPKAAAARGQLGEAARGYALASRRLGLSLEDAVKALKRGWADIGGEDGILTGRGDG
jgi:DNA-binding transcriptional regulator YhcF (GntR family)